MRKVIRACEENLRRILGRQPNCAFNSNYEAAIKATPQEAPRDSRPCILSVSKFGNKQVHLLSRAERNAAILGLFHPNVFWVHEQFALPIGPEQHPLAQHPLGVGHAFPRFKGSLDACERLECVSRHPRFYCTLKEGAGRELIPFPYIGDLLWFLKSPTGPYCLNWSIKPEQDDFKENELRHKLEANTLLEASIRTVFVGVDRLNQVLLANLFECFKASKRTIPLVDAVRRDLIGDFQHGIDIGRTPLDTSMRYVRRGHLEVSDASALFYRSLWERSLKADLFGDIIFDKEVSMFGRDPIDAYANLFAK